jgi:hypothetical protein
VAPDGSQDRYIALRDVGCISRLLQQENICLHPEDTISTRLWVDGFKEDGIYTFYKDKLDLNQDCNEMPLCYAFTLAFKWTHSGTLVVDLLVLMQHIIPLNIKIFCCSQSSYGIIGDMVSDLIGDLD